MAIGIDAAAVRSRRLYLPWEAGKPPDLALEVASESTADNDTGHKRERYQSIGVTEYWRFDATGGNYYGEPLVGEQLIDGRYQRLEITREPDGSLWGYSPTLDLYLVWQPHPEAEAWLCLYDPTTNQRLQPYGPLRQSAESARAEAAAARAEAAASEQENRSLREQIRRLLGR